MSGLCGWAGFTASEETRRRLLEAMGGALGRHDGSELASVSTIACGAAVAALHGNASLCQEGDVVAAICGRPHFTDGALRELAARHGNAHALAVGYRKHGETVLDFVRGRFALAVVVEGTWEALLATDRMGTVPLAYSYRDGVLVFGTSGAALQLHPRGESEIDRQALFNYFFFHQVPAPGTIRKHHRRLLPGHRLTLEGKKIEVRAYAHAPFDPQRRPVSELEKEFLGLLDSAVGRAAGDAEVGCFLSGGTDSSTVVGVLSDRSKNPVRTYSIGFAAEGYDEMEYARCASERFGSELHEYYVTPDDVAEAIHLVASAHSDPFANESAVPAYFCARLAARDGIRRMLAGDGGDELFAGNAVYAKMRVFDRYEKVPRFLRKLLETFLWMVPAGDRIWPVRKARSYVSQARTPMPDRTYVTGLMLHLGAERMFEPDFLAMVDQNAPLDLARHIYRSVQAKDPLNKELGLDYKFILADNDLPKVVRSCEAAGVEVAFPFLDDEMVAFAGRLPVNLKLKGGRLRWFFKHALRDFLPQKILTKKKHGFGLPFGVWLRDHEGLKELVSDSLADLRKRGIVRPAFLDEVIELHRTDNAYFFGVMIWMLVMLEQWYQVHEDQKATVAS